MTKLFSKLHILHIAITVNDGVSVSACLIVMQTVPPHIQYSSLIEPKITVGQLNHFTTCTLSPDQIQFCSDTVSDQSCQTRLAGPLHIIGHNACCNEFLTMTEQAQRHTSKLIIISDRPCSSV